MNEASTRVLNTLVHDLFWKSAVDDYMTARWAWFSEQPGIFLWSALQTLEKLMKCSLLLNGQNVKKDGHKLTTLWAKLNSICEGILGLVFCPPNEITTPRSGFFGRFEAYESFVERIEQNGKPANRYNTYSTLIDDWDLHKLDELTFQLCRVCVPLGAEVYRELGSYREYLKVDPNFQPNRISPRRASPQNPTIEQNNNLLKMHNFSFFRSEAQQQGRLTFRSSARNSPLWMARKSEGFSEAVTWLKENASFDKSDQRFLNELLADNTL
ncbi:hypothetical protein WG622_05075 [Cognatishimia sp. D5M38]|uniref:HEPN domain-containing protein n=1 Tax=Cognatishimia coralii TaxID=3083254 RepID=A0ABU8QDW8_9RHOB